MMLTIGGHDHTSALKDGTLTLRHYGALRSTFSAVLFFSDIPLFFPLVGQEIKIYENDAVLWGGILIEAEAEFHSPKSATVSLRGQGYEQILHRYCLPSIELTSMTPSNAATYIFNTYLHPDDELILGTVDEGLSAENEYSFYPAKASSVFDYLAGENGYRWWVDSNKNFNMRAFLPQKSGLVTLDLTEEDPYHLNDLQTLVYRASTSGYRNVQYAFNKTRNLDGNSREDSEVLKMRKRYGSGEYGAASSSSVIYTQTDGQQIAKRILSANPETGELELTTDCDTFSLGQVFTVKIPFCGIETAQNFCVTEIRSVYFIDRFRYTVIAKETTGATLFSMDWQNTLANGNKYE